MVAEDFPINLKMKLGVTTLIVGSTCIYFMVLLAAADLFTPLVPVGAWSLLLHLAVIAFLACAVGTFVHMFPARRFLAILSVVVVGVWALCAYHNEPIWGIILSGFVAVYIVKGAATIDFLAKRYKTDGQRRVLELVVTFAYVIELLAFGVWLLVSS